MRQEFDLGQTVKDKYTSFTGVVTGYYVSLGNAPSYRVETHTNNSKVEAMWLGPERLVLLD